MGRIVKTREKAKGKPPGSLVHISNRPHSDVKIKVTNFNGDKFDERFVDTIEECLQDIEDSGTITWINIEGLADSNVIKNIGELFGIHTLWLEDVLNTDHRPKLEELDDLIFSIIKAVDYNGRRERKVSFEQVSLFLSRGFVISFQEFPGDTFHSVTTRLKKMKGRIRQSQADYLFYAIIDGVVDEYFSVLEKIGDEVESLETNIFENFNPGLYKEVSRLRNELIYLKKSALPIGEVLKQCIRTEKKEVGAKTRKYFKDSFDNILQVSDVIESYFGMLEAAKDSFNCVQANKMNEIMKVLTIFSAIFIPLTFIAGVYGMNFRHIPELEWSFGYAYVWGLLLAVAVSLCAFFRWKKWF